VYRARLFLFLLFWKITVNFIPWQIPDKINLVDVEG